jgi:hypothetical protein
MCHANNTFDKRSIRDSSGNPLLRETGLKLKDFVRSATHREFYLSLSNDATI